MKKISIITIITFILCINITNISFCDDKYITYKMNTFINKKIDSKEILNYIELNHKNIKDEKIKEKIMFNFIKYNERYLNDYQKNFDEIYKYSIKSIQIKQNLKSEINKLNKLDKYVDIDNHQFKFIDNRPELVKELKKIYISGYKLEIINRKFVLKVNYHLLENSY